MSRVFAILTVCAAMSGVAAVAEAWQWPVPVPVVRRTFATPVDDSILRGVELGGGAQPVFAVNDGVVVYVHRETKQFGHPFGSFVVVEHDQAFRSIYAHLSPESLPPVGRQVDSGSQIGIVGESGVVRQPALRLYLFDIQNQSYVNPMLLLPNIEDAAVPVIGTLFAIGEAGVFNLDAVSSLPPGTYSLSVEINDAVGRRGARGEAAPYVISLFLDGQQQFVMRADGLSVEQGSIQIAPHANGSQVYGPQGAWSVGTVSVPDGTVTIELVVADFAGNERVRTVLLEGSTENEDVQ